MGCRCASRFTAPATQTVPKIENRTKCSIVVPPLSSAAVPRASSPQIVLARCRRYDFNATISAVTTRFAIASGSKNFQPKAMSWS